MFCYVMMEWCLDGMTSLCFACLVFLKSFANQCLLLILGTCCMPWWAELIVGDSPSILSLDLQCLLYKANFLAGN